MEAREQKKKKEQRVIIVVLNGRNDCGYIFIFFLFLTVSEQGIRAYVYEAALFSLTQLPVSPSLFLPPAHTTFFFAYPVLLASLSLPPRSCFVSEKRGYRVPSRSCYKQVPQVKKG